jgi:Spy/CpxP family protein refolding chaperone
MTALVSLLMLACGASAEPQAEEPAPAPEPTEEAAPEQPQTHEDARQEGGLQEQVAETADKVDALLEAMQALAEQEDEPEPEPEDPE